MKITRCLTLHALAAAAMTTLSSSAFCAILPVTNWALHNQLGADTPTIAAGTEITNSPLFDVDANKDNAVFMGKFPNIQLANDGDYIKVSTTLTMTGRTNNVGAVGLNTMLRLGLYDGPDGAVGANDFPNIGLFMVYGNVNQAANRQIRAQASATETNPFVQTSDIVQGTDTGNQIQGANPGPVLFELTLTRNAGLLDIVGKISGTDSASAQPYVANYATTGYNASGIGMAFDRVGFFFGSQVNAPSALLADVTIETNVPEPSSCLLAAAAAVGVMTGRRTRRLNASGL